MTATPDQPTATDTAREGLRTAAVVAQAIHDAECEAYTHEGRNARCERSARVAAEALAAAGLIAAPPDAEASAGTEAVRLTSDEAEWIDLAFMDAKAGTTRALHYAVEVVLRDRLAAALHAGGSHEGGGGGE